MVSPTRLNRWIMEVDTRDFCQYTIDWLELAMSVLSSEPCHTPAPEDRLGSVSYGAGNLLEIMDKSMPDATLIKAIIEIIESEDALVEYTHLVDLS